MEKEVASRALIYKRTGHRHAIEAECNRFQLLMRGYQQLCRMPLLDVIVRSGHQSSDSNSETTSA